MKHDDPLKRPGAPVAVLVLNWNGWADTIECLESVLRLDYPNFQVIVCDNGSTDGSIDRFLDWAAGRLDVIPERRQMDGYVQPSIQKPLAVRTLARAEAEHDGSSTAEEARLVLIANGANLGFAGGNNVGLRHALARGFEFVWLLNSDTIVAPGSLRPLVTRLQNDPEAGMCGSLLCYYDAPDILDQAGGCAYYPALGMARRIMSGRPVNEPADWRQVEGRLGYVSGASCLVRRSFLQDIGLMTEDHFLYGEEIDWAIRGKGLYKLALAPDSLVYHKKGRSIGSKSYGLGRSATSAYYLWRASHRVTRRYYPFGLPALVSLGLLSAARAYLHGDKGSASAILRGTFNRDYKQASKTGELAQNSTSPL